MSPLLTPTAALGLFGAAAAALVLLHLLRPRSVQIRVPGLAPWRALRRSKPPRPWRRLVALALQLSIAALIAWALLDRGPGEGAGEVVVIVDGSASMQGRMDAAREVVGGAGVALAGDAVRLLAWPGEPEGRQAAALSQLQAGGGASLERARALVEALGFEARVLTDAPGDGVEVVGAGATGPSLRSLEAAAGPGLPPEIGLTARVHNPSADAMEAQLTLRTDQGPLGEATLSVEGGETAERTWWFPPTGARWVEASLASPSADPGRTAEARRAWAVMPALPPAEVWLVSDGAPALELALAAMPGLEIRRISPGQWRGAPEQVSVVFFDRVAPRIRAPGAAIYLDPPLGAGPLPPLAVAEAPVFAAWDRDHALLRGVDLQRIEAARASVLPRGRGWTALAEIEPGADHPGGPVIAARDDDGTPTVVIGFDPARTALPRTVAWPQWIYRLVVNARRAPSPPRGQPAARGLPPGATPLEPTDRPGSPGLYALSEADAAEDDEDGGGSVLPVRLLAVNPDPAEAPTPHDGDPPPEPGPAEDRRAPPWSWALLAGAALMLAEFAVGGRR